MRPTRLLLVIVLCVAGAVSATPASAATVRGPAGLRIVRPPATVTCPPARVSVSIRFTAASARRGVRAARVELRDTGTRKTVRAKRRGLRRVRVAIPCGSSFKLRVAALGRGGKVLGRKSFRVTSRTASGGPAPKPGAPPAAEARLPGSSTRWIATVDARRTGPRAGQTCVQLSATTPERGVGLGSFCGLLSEDPIFAKAQESDDPGGGSRKLVLAGAANLDTVASVSVFSPTGTQDLKLSAPEESAPGSGGAFIAVFDTTTTDVDDLTLVVELKNGSTQAHSSPSSINLRNQNGQRI